MQKSQLDKSNGEPTEVISRYLEAIYYMWSEGEPPRSARLADWLGVSRPTVTVALRRMTRDGMVRMNARKDIELTVAGRRAAESIVRRHRIMERWLTDVLGLDWVVADAEAARLEHAISEVVEKRLYETLGRPKTCPTAIRSPATRDRLRENGASPPSRRAPGPPSPACRRSLSARLRCCSPTCSNAA